MTWILMHLLPIAGPAWVAVRGFVPSLGAVKGVAIGLMVASMLAAGGYAGWTIHAWGEAPRLAKAKKDAVVRANLQAEIEAKQQALGKQAALLADREKSLAETASRNSELNRTLEDLRAQSSQAYDAAAPVLMSDDPWLRDRPRAGSPRLERRDRSDANRVPAVRSSRPGGS